MFKTAIELSKVKKAIKIEKECGKKEMGWYFNDRKALEKVKEMGYKVAHQTMGCYVISWR